MLQDELNAARAELQSFQEEMESSNEELETSKEELQSFNEKLQTVNTQLEQKITELEETTNDLDNLLAGTEIATLFLDTHLAIKWFTPQTVSLFDLQSSDLGRSISHFAHKFAGERLETDAEQVLKTLASTEVEVRSTSGRWYLRCILTYRTRDNHIEGVVLTFSDITELKASAHEIDNARRFAEAIVETIRQPLLVLDANLRVQSSNRVFTELFRVEVNQTVGSLIYDLGNGQWNIPELRRRLEETISENHAFNDVEIERDFEKIGERSMLLNGRKLVQADGQTSLILLAIEDVTERKAARAHQDVLVGELNHRVKNVMATVQAVATQTLSNATSLENARTAFSARLFAMASAHDLLTHEGWAGTELGAVVKATIDPHTGGKNRFAVKGPNVCVQARSALSVAMALHELSTNAAQYGALSVKNGHVDIVWRAEGDKDNRRLHFIWSESGGRLIKPPDKKGFGSRLVEKALAAELNAKVSISYKTQGVVCMIDTPLTSDPELADLLGT